MIPVGPARVKSMRGSPRRQLSIVFLSASMFLSTLLLSGEPAQPACREPDVASGLGSVAYAAGLDATIQYFGHNFFLITTRKGTRIVTDPLGPGWYPTPNVAADIVTVGKEQYNHNAVEIVQGRPLILRGLTQFGADWNKVSMSFKDVFIYNVPIHQNAEVMYPNPRSHSRTNIGTQNSKTAGPRS